MNNTLLKTLESKPVQKVTGNLKMNTDRLAGMWFEAGFDYLDNLKSRIRSKRTFDAQFRPMIQRNSAFGKLRPEQVFEQISKSDAFWQWWAQQLWCICTETTPENVTELGYLLRFNDQLIPIFTLNKIFYGEQKHDAGQRTGGTPAEKNGQTPEKAGPVAKRVASGVHN